MGRDPTNHQRKTKKAKAKEKYDRFGGKTNKGIRIKEEKTKNGEKNHLKINNNKT